MLSTELTKLEAELVLAGLEKVLKAQGTGAADKEVAKALAERLAAETEAAYKPPAPRVPVGELEALSVEEDDDGDDG